jgi:hypothetical protein
MLPKTITIRDGCIAARPVVKDAYAERFPKRAVLSNQKASAWLSAFLKHTDKQAGGYRAN